MKETLCWEEGGLSAPKKIAIETLGCKVNQFDSHQLSELFKKEAYEEVSPTESADIYIVNSCTVTAKADQEAKHLLRRFQRKNPNAILVLTGCLASTQGEKLKNLGVHYVVGNTLKTELPQILKQKSPVILTESGFKPDISFPLIPIHAAEDKTRVFLKIQDGCNDFCTFCIIPYARGKSRSLA